MKISVVSGKDKETIDMIFTARKLQEKCQEQNIDTVFRDGPTKIMAKFVCPPRSIAVVRKFHDDMQARVQL